MSIVVMELLHTLGCLCSLRYPAYSAHASCCRVLPVRLYSFFFHVISNGAIFGTSPENGAVSCTTRLLMMDRKPVRNMWSSIPKINVRI